jgi:hypothetical protein
MNVLGEKVQRFGKSKIMKVNGPNTRRADNAPEILER